MSSPSLFCFMTFFLHDNDVMPLAKTEEIEKTIEKKDNDVDPLAAFYCFVYLFCLVSNCFVTPVAFYCFVYLFCFVSNCFRSRRRRTEEWITGSPICSWVPLWYHFCFPHWCLYAPPVRLLFPLSLTPSPSPPLSTF